MQCTLKELAPFLGWEDIDKDAMDRIGSAWRTLLAKGKGKGKSEQRVNYNKQQPAADSKGKGGRKGNTPGA